MVSKEAFKNGILAYLDLEVMPHLPTSGKWGLGAISAIAAYKFDNIFNSIKDNAIPKQLDIISAEEYIDIDMLADAVGSSADKYGKLTLSLPIVGKLTFSKEDVYKLKDCIYNCENTGGNGWNC